MEIGSPITNVPLFTAKSSTINLTRIKIPHILDMKTRYIFAKDPIIFLESGLLLPDDDTPSVMSLRTFFNGIIDTLFVQKNPVSEHVCSDACWQEVQVHIGTRDKASHIGKSVPRKGE